MSEHEIQVPIIEVPASDGWETIPTDVYRLTISKVVEVRNADYGGVVKPDKFNVNLEFTVVDDESPMRGKTFRQWFGLSVAEKSHLRPLVEAIRGGDPLPAREAFNLKDYLHRPFVGMVSEEEKASTRNPGTTLMVNRLKSAMAFKA